MECSTILLAGGEGRRFRGSNTHYKAFLKFKGLPLFLRVLRQLPSYIQDITIVTAKHHMVKFEELIEQYTVQPKPKLAYDEPPFQGPMNGILTGMQLAHYDKCLVVPCDVPLIKTEVLQVLINHLEQANDSPAVIPRWPNGYREPLTAIYRKSLLLEPLRRYFQQGERKIQNVLDDLPEIRYIPIACLQKVDPELHSFINVNTKDDFRELSRVDPRSFG